MLEVILKHFKNHPQPADDIVHTEANQDMQTHTLLLSNREPSYVDTH